MDERLYSSLFVTRKWKLLCKGYQNTACENVLNVCVLFIGSVFTVCCKSIVPCFGIVNRISVNWSIRNSQVLL